jgi:hypothetical protein
MYILYFGNPPEIWKKRSQSQKVPRSSPHVAGPRAALDHGHPSILIRCVNHPAQPESFVKCKKEIKSTLNGYNARERGPKSRRKETACWICPRLWKEMQVERQSLCKNEKKGYSREVEVVG